ncbi:MAG: DsbC family protein [Pseudomonadota bacterium]
MRIIIGGALFSAAVFLSAISIAHMPAFAEPATDMAEAHLKQILAERLPKSEVSQINCDGFGGLCQIVTGDNIVYTDKQASVLFVGRAFNMATGADLTSAARQRLGVSQPAVPTVAQYSVDWTDLPASGAIIRNAGAAHRIAVISDLHCGYCHRLDAELQTLTDVEIHEYLIGYPGRDDAAKAVYCAEDPNAALAKAYEAGPPPDGNPCDTDKVAANTAFFEQRAFAGTPVIIRSDGAVIEGFKDAAFLKLWIAAANTDEAVQ